MRVENNGVYLTVYPAKNKILLYQGEPLTSQFANVALDFDTNLISEVEVLAEEIEETIVAELQSQIINNEEDISCLTDILIEVTTI